MATLVDYKAWARKMVKVESIAIYPLKSSAGLALDHATLTPRGLAHDRRWMLIDQSNQFVSARTLPKLLSIQSTVTESGLRLRLPQHGLDGSQRWFEAEIPITDAKIQVSTTLWSQACDANLIVGPINHVLSNFLGTDVRLAYQADHDFRAVDEKYGRSMDQVSFADGFPIHIISQSALEQLNSRANRTLAMRQFRPNIVVSGCAAHDEDNWQRVRIGDSELDVVKPCVRCVLTTIDPMTHTPDPTREPLATLKHYRRGEKGITFGMNAIPRVLGEIRVGDLVEVISRH